MSPENLEDNLTRADELYRETNRAGIAFVVTDLDTALTFSTIALSSPVDSDKRRRNREYARKGYDAVCFFIEKFDRSQASSSELVGFDEKLATLRARLVELGEELH